jgi:hypothetical protein
MPDAALFWGQVIHICEVPHNLASAEPKALHEPALREVVQAAKSSGLADVGFYKSF